MSKCPKWNCCATYIHIEYISNSKWFQHLLLRSTVKDHFGQYGIKVQNDGSIDLTLKLLLIEYPVTVQPSYAYCNTSTRVNLVCQFAAEDAKDWQTYWTHNRNENFIKTLPGFVNGNESILQISFCDYRDEGDYICKWKTQFKEYFASSFVRPNDPPRITDTGHWREEQNIWMTVDFYSVQESIVHWFKNDKELAVSRRIRIATSSSIVKLNYTNKMIKDDGFKSKLCISNFSSNDITSYSCQIVNIYGSVEYTFEDHLLNNTFNQYAYEGQSTEMYTTQQDSVDMKKALTDVVNIVIYLIFFSSSNEQDPNEHEHEYDDIESIPMNRVDYSNAENNTRDESDTEREHDIKNQRGTTSEANGYLDMNESKFAMYTYI
ncbi:TTN [Mytilus edulis]|uniref:TTN n=1 Tax=Mytilus edulis TaxID=6550 RepID=A0A8S3T4Y2_MYTED|nr:TTN [Mytilus edulis]